MAISKSEQSYVKSSILANPPQRADGRGLLDYRSIGLQAGGDVAPLANGSARVDVGGTEVIAAVRLEVEDIGGGQNQGDDEGLGREGGRISCSVSCSSSAYPNHTSPQLDDLSADLTNMIQPAFSSALTPSEQLTIVPEKKSWLLSIDALILSDSGNVVDAICIAIRGALWDLRIPRTRSVEYKSRETDGQGDGMKDLLKERRRNDAADFELQDYWDEGEPLVNRKACPVGITLNLIPPLYFLDATNREEESAPDRLILIYSFRDVTRSSLTPGTLHGTHLIGPGELPYKRLGPLILEGEKHARELTKTINAMLIGEDAKVAAQAAAYR